VELLSGECEEEEQKLSPLAGTPPSPSSSLPTTMTMPSCQRHLPSVIPSTSSRSPLTASAPLLPATPVTPSLVPLSPSPPRFRPPPTPPPIKKLPTSWRKVLCWECHRDGHDISYLHCMEFYGERLPVLLS
jgi:hypothetical protein